MFAKMRLNPGFETTQQINQRHNAAYRPIFPYLCQNNRKKTDFMAQHNDLGKWGESAVADYLAERGYAIVERNWRLGKIEIDIIASKGTDIVFVEVKTRREPSANPFEAMPRQKDQMLLRGANAYIDRKSVV